MVLSDETRDSDPLAPRHDSLPTLKEECPSRRGAAKPVDLQEQSMETRESPRAVQKERMDLLEERGRLRTGPTRWQEQPTGLRTAETAMRPEKTRLERMPSAAPSPPWIAARSGH